jgi:hypothetical protein
MTLLGMILTKANILSRKVGNAIQHSKDDEPKDSRNIEIESGVLDSYITAGRVLTAPGKELNKDIHTDPANHKEREKTLNEQKE